MFVRNPPDPSSRVAQSIDDRRYTAVVRITFIACAVAATLFPARAFADVNPLGSPEEKSLTEKIGIPPAGKDGGFGASVLANVTQLFFSGRYNVLAAGIGLGASWKNGSGSRFPLEIGAYVAPQFAGDQNNSSGVVATLLHITILKGFGIGIGLDAWRKGIGFGGGGWSDRTFVTLGYGITNDTKTAP